jgi:uncharacterized repeat protein (TIGR03806 family)
VFSDLAALTPQPGIVPYEINVPFWSDNAIKTRWFSVPGLNQKMTFNANGNWSFPTGTVWVKHFELELTNGVPSSRQRLETRLVVKTSDSVYGLTYRWGDSTTDATLVAENGMDETFTIYGEGGPRTQVWRYPARSECLTCHTPVGGHALGFNTWQLIRDFNYPGGAVNQIQALSDAGYFSNPVSGTSGLLALAHATNTEASLEFRVRSYLTANCVQCHQPGGTGGGFWDARITTPLEAAGLINGPLRDDGGNPSSRVIKPASPELSMLLTRISSSPPRRMPPLATAVFDTNNMNLVTEWIRSLPDTRLIPVVKLHFDEGSGLFTTNSGSAGGTLALTTPTPAWSGNIPVATGASLDFGATPGNFVAETASPLSALAGLSEVTITGWINCRDATAGSGGNRLVTWINNGGDGLDLVYLSDGSLRLGIDQWPDGSPARSSGGKIQTDASAGLANWRFFAVTYDAGVAQVKFYFGSDASDASLDVTRSYPGRGAVGTAIGRLAIGHFNSATRSIAQDRIFRGLIDEVCVFPGALTPSEIITVQRAEGGPPPPPPPPPPTNVTIAISVSPAGGGTASGGGSYSSGTSVTVAATANAGFNFVNWTESGSVVSSAASYTFTATADRTLVANFTAVSTNGPVPIVKLSFDEVSGTATANAGSAGGTLTLTTPTPAHSANVPGVGGARSVDFGAAPGNFVVESAAPLSALAGLNAFTVCGWVNCRSAAEGPGGNRIVTWINKGGDGVDLVFRSDGSLQIGIDQWPDFSPARSSGGRIPVDFAASAGNWRFFAVTYDAASAQVKFYFGSDSADAAIDVARAYAGRGAVGTGIWRLALGHFNSATRASAQDRIFRGLIDEIQIFGRELSLAEIIAVQRNDGSPPPPPPPPTTPEPLVYLALEETSGVTTANAGSLGGTLTLTTPTPIRSANVPSVGGARSVDFGATTGNFGIDTASPLSGLAGLNNFSICGWINCRNATEGSGGNRIVSWINNGGDGVDLVYRSDGSLQIGIDQWPDFSPARSSGGKIPTDTAAGAGNWRFFAVTYDGGIGQVQFYFGSPTVEAALDVTRAYARGPVGAGIERLTLGHFNLATRPFALDRMFRGLIDEVRVYGQVLTLAQIRAVQQGAAPAPAVGTDEETGIRISGIELREGGRVRLWVIGEAGTAYRVLASSDLIEWRELGSSETGADGAFEFVDETAHEYPSRFYRLARP